MKTISVDQFSRHNANTSKEFLTARVTVRKKTWLSDSVESFPVAKHIGSWWFHANTGEFLHYEIDRALDGATRVFNLQGVA